MAYLGALSVVQAATDCQAVTEISEVECESLLQLYQSTDGAHWKNKQGWNLTDKPCGWYGVSCENHGVTRIELGSNNLNGTLPDFRGLPKLQRLELDRNQLTGAIPDFTALTHLKALDIRNNQVCKNTNINYMEWPIKRAKYGDEITWQAQLKALPFCSVNN
jgi:hypothetical protein